MSIFLWKGGLLSFDCLIKDTVSKIDKIPLVGPGATLFANTSAMVLSLAVEP